MAIYNLQNMIHVFDHCNFYINLFPSFTTTVICSLILCTLLAYNLQTFWNQIRLLPFEQSGLGSYFMFASTFKSFVKCICIYILVYFIDKCLQM